MPLVTWIGDTFASRVAASIVGAAGIPELVTQNAEACYALALELAAKPKRLKALKGKLARNRMKCPLFDSARFTRNLGDAYERMWENHRTGSRQPIVVKDSGV